MPVPDNSGPRPGDLLHVEIKPLGHRIHGERRRSTPEIGWESLHVVINDHGPLAYVEVLPGQLGTTLRRFFAQSGGVTVRR